MPSDPQHHIPDAVQSVHLIAVCGTAMGALAAMLQEIGLSVTGSDRNVYPPMSDFLNAKGVTVMTGFEASHLAYRPDLVVVADDTLVPVPAAGVLAGLDADSVLLIHSHESAETWRQRLNTPAHVLVLPLIEESADRSDLAYIGAVCAGASACLLGVIEREVLAQAIAEELAELGADIVSQNSDSALAAFDAMAAAGLRFDRFYAAAPVCSPTRGSVLTGRHPNRFPEALGAHRHNHELLEVDGVVRVFAAVDDVHHGNRQASGVDPPEVSVQR